MYLHNSAMRVGLSLSVLVIIGLTLGGVPSGSVRALPSHRQVQKLATPIGIAAVTSARQEVTIQSDWDRTTAVHPLAIHFCSMECKDEYMARLFAPQASVKEVVVERAAPVEIVVEQVVPEKRRIITKARKVRHQKRTARGCKGYDSRTSSTESSWPQKRTQCSRSTRSDESYQRLLPRSQPTSRRIPRCLGLCRLSRI